jgi:hypothetical protein
MTPGELRMQVVRETGATVLVLALAAGWLAGLPGFIGVAAAGAITLTNFWWLARGVFAIVGSGHPVAASVAGAPVAAPTDAAAARPAPAAWPVRAVWIVAAGARFLLLTAAFAALCAMGWAHPVAIVVGLTVLPCDLIALGLRTARD